MNNYQINQIKELLNKIISPSPNLSLNGVFDGKTSSLINTFLKSERNYEFQNLFQVSPNAILEIGSVCKEKFGIELVIG